MNKFLILMIFAVLHAHKAQAQTCNLGLGFAINGKSPGADANGYILDSVGETERGYNCCVTNRVKNLSGDLELCTIHPIQA